MFEFGFTKLVLVAAVALIVIGPERLPTLAYKAGKWWGKLQTYLHQIQAEVRANMAKAELDQLHTDLQESVHSVERSFYEVEKDLQQTMADIKPSENTLNISHDFVRTLRFQKNKLRKTSQLPQWYKVQQGKKRHVISAAARVARYRI